MARQDEEIDPLYDDEEDELTPEELSVFKERLLEERRQVLYRLNQRRAEMVDTDHSADELDQAGKISDQAFILRLADKERKLLSQIDHALSKFDTGEFGLCEGTGEPIKRKRLELRPWTRYSIEYKEELELRKKRGEV